MISVKTRSDMPAEIMALVFVLAMLVVAPGLVPLLTRDASAEDAFQKLSGAQIRAKVAGMEIHRRCALARRL
jgi:hypothetical protein